MRIFALFLSIVLGCPGVTAAERVVETVVITTKPRFERVGSFVDLIISDTNHHNIRLDWRMLPDTHYIPVSLDTNRVYTFTVDQKPDHTSYGAAITVPELRKVQWSGQTIYDIEVCEIHKGKMEHEEVRVLYGLIRPEPGEPSGDEEQRLFPHRHEMLLGGCVSWPNSPKTKKVYVCGECTKAFDKWKSEKTQTK